MAASSDFLPFATGSGANVTSQSDWAALAARTGGFSSGLASSAQFNKALRQASFVAAAFASWVSTQADVAVADDGVIDNFTAQISAALGAFIQQGIYSADSGSTNALVATLDPAPAAYSAGMQLAVKVAKTNTGATTINVNGLGAKSIVFGGAALTAGTLVAGQVYTLIYDGTAFQIGTGAPTVPYVSAVSMGTTSFFIQWSNGFKLQVQDITYSGGVQQTFSYASAFNVRSRAWVNGDDNNTDVSFYVISTTATTATVRSPSSSSASLQLFSFGY